MIDLDAIVPLPEFFTAQWEAPLGEIRAGYEGKVCGEKNAVALRIAAWNAALETAAHDCDRFRGYHTAIQAQVCENLAESIRTMRIEPEERKLERSSMIDYFQGFVADKSHPLMSATGSDGRCELCGLRESPLHDTYEASK